MKIKNNKIRHVTCVAILLSGIVAKCSAVTLYVSRSGIDSYTSIISAVEAAVDGDTIYVRSGDYFGAGVLINKSVVIKGENPKTTKYTFQLGAITILAPKVILEGLTIHEIDASSQTGGAIAFENISPIIRNNIFTGSVVAISVQGNAKPIIQNNDFLTEIGIRLENNANNIDARFNWWNTIDRVSIEGKIWDGNDLDGLGVVEFEPWLNESIGVIPTSMSITTWATMKKMKNFIGGGE